MGAGSCRRWGAALRASLSFCARAASSNDSRGGAVRVGAWCIGMAGCGVVAVAVARRGACFGAALFSSRATRWIVRETGCEDGLLVSAVPRSRVQLAPTILVRAAIGAHRACDMYIVAASSPCREMSYSTD
jgi:hypothetical protein